jgi:hypothetical protein
MGNDDIEDDDDEILMAASAWASAQDDDGDSSTDDDKHTRNIKTKNRNSNQEKVNTTDKLRNTKSRSTTNTSASAVATITARTTTTNYSLHLKNIPYDASQSDIRFAFLDKRCNVTSVRLVYDRDQKTGEKHFRGVAFVDFGDEESYQRGLTEFHNKAFLGKGRRVNVRPTRTKSELSDIVRRTEEKVANLIARSKEQKKDDGGGTEMGGGNDKDNSSKQGKKKKDKKKNRRRNTDGIDNKNKESLTADIPISNSRVDGHESLSGSVHDKTESETSAAPTVRVDQNKRKRDDTSDATIRLPTPPSKKKMKDRVSKSKNTNSASTNPTNSASNNPEGSSPVKLSKKQRAKKAAVLRMLKFKGKKS